MEQLSKVEKFVLAYLWYEYGGSTYFMRGSKAPEEFLAEMIVNDVMPERRPRHYMEALEAVKRAIKKLCDFWALQLSGYEVSLTVFGQQLVQNISKDEYQKLREDIVKGRLA